MTEALLVKLNGIARVLRAMLGAPDYVRYVDHVKVAHPGREPMSCEQFMSDRMNDRYSRPGTRCC